MCYFNSEETFWKWHFEVAIDTAILEMVFCSYPTASKDGMSWTFFFAFLVQWTTIAPIKVT